VDPEVAEVPGPQLVVPASVPPYALNAANARWGLLYDALHATDALPSEHDLALGYDERRGAQVIAETDRLLDLFFPLVEGTHADVVAYVVPSPGELVVDMGTRTTGLAEPTQFAGHRSSNETRPDAVLLRRHGLHLELAIDPSTRVGAQHHARVSDVLLESALTTIVDLEDSVAAVDGQDKVIAYRTWLGLNSGNLSATFSKNGRSMTRTLHPDRTYVGVDGQQLTLPVRALLLVRNVGHHLCLHSVLNAAGEQLLEEVLDALVSAMATLHDLHQTARYANTRTGSVYIVKPKMHGPDEVALSVEILSAVEQALGLEPATIKIGIMDEEKRTSVNLEACIARSTGLRCRDDQRRSVTSWFGSGHGPVICLDGASRGGT
jgi:malate synthase